MFIVQTAVHADPGSHHATAEEALAAIEEMVREGIVEPDDFTVREIDDDGRTVRVFGLSQGTPATGAARP